MAFVLVVVVSSWCVLLAGSITFIVSASDRQEMVVRIIGMGDSGKVRRGKVFKNRRRRR